MRGGALPPSLLSAALGFALAFAPKKALLPGIGLLVAGAAVGRLAPIPTVWTDAVFLAAWAAIVAVAASIHLPGGTALRLAMAMAAVAGLLSGALVNVAGKDMDLAVALPWVLLALPGGWLVQRGYGIALKVAGSWLIAIALLAAGLSFVKTPGYMPDHME